MNSSLALWCLSVSSAVRVSVFEILLEMWIKNVPRLLHQLLTACRSCRALPVLVCKVAFFLEALRKTVLFFSTDFTDSNSPELNVTSS